MKTSKFMALMLAMVAGMFLFASCGSDSDDDNGDDAPNGVAGANWIVGYWQIEVEGDYPWHLSADGVFDYCDGKGRWTFENDLLILFWDEDEAEGDKVTKISDDEFVWNRKHVHRIAASQFVKKGWNSDKED